MTTYGPYTPVRRAGSLLFVSGQIGIDPTTKQAKNGILQQTEQALNNLKKVLESEGASLDNIVKTTVFLTTMDNFEVMNSVYEKVFAAPRPARSTVGVQELPRVGDAPLLVEIEAVACKEAA